MHTTFTGIYTTFTLAVTVGTLHGIGHPSMKRANAAADVPRSRPPRRRTAAPVAGRAKSHRPSTRPAKIVPRRPSARRSLLARYPPASPGRVNMSTWRHEASRRCHEIHRDVTKMSRRCHRNVTRVSRNVTGCHEVSRGVTRCHEVSRACHGVSRRVTACRHVTRCHG